MIENDIVFSEVHEDFYKDELSVVVKRSGTEHFLILEVDEDEAHCSLSFEDEAAIKRLIASLTKAANIIGNKGLSATQHKETWS